MGINISDYKFNNKKEQVNERLYFKIKDIRTFNGK